MVTQLRYAALILPVTLILLATQTYSQGFDYSKYKPRTLDEVATLNPGPAKEKDEKKLAYITAEWFHSQVRLKYIGTSRPLTPMAKEILGNW